MAWNEVEVQEQRIQFVVAAARKEKAMKALCEEFGICRSTGYKWLQRYRTRGVAGVQEQSRRPRRSPGQTTVEIEQKVVAERVKRRFVCKWKTAERGGESSRWCLSLFAFATW